MCNTNWYHITRLSLVGLPTYLHPVFILLMITQEYARLYTCPWYMILNTKFYSMIEASNMHCLVYILIGYQCYQDRVLFGLVKSLIIAI